MRLRKNGLAVHGIADWTCVSRATNDMRAARDEDATWRGGRAAEGARLESVYAGNCIAGSNPAPSAKSDIKRLFCNGFICYQLACAQDFGQASPACYRT